MEWRKITRDELAALIGEKIVEINKTWSGWEIRKTPKQKAAIRRLERKRRKKKGKK